jgi:NTE family protein
MSSAPKSKSALVLAGGGMTGAAYEIGALTALDRLFAPEFSSSRFK